MSVTLVCVNLAFLCSSDNKHCRLPHCIPRENVLTVRGEKCNMWGGPADTSPPDLTTHTRTKEAGRCTADPRSFRFRYQLIYLIDPHWAAEEWVTMLCLAVGGGRLSQN